MGLLNFRRQPKPPTWVPTGSEPVTISASAMDDDGCAGKHAHGVTFTCDAAPGAEITCWFYPVYGGPDSPSDYALGVRYDYDTSLDDGNGPWSYSGWEPYAEGQWWDSLDDADNAASHHACGFAHGPAPTGTELPQIFCWDGQPFETPEG